jgi:hypothetical protein
MLLAPNTAKMQGNAVGFTITGKEILNYIGKLDKIVSIWDEARFQHCNPYYFAAS